MNNVVSPVSPSCRYTVLLTKVVGHARENGYFTTETQVEILCVVKEPYEALRVAKEHARPHHDSAVVTIEVNSI